MGGLITIALVERYPEQFDGGLAVCGIVGGALKAVNTIFETHTIVDYLYPTLLPWDIVHIPEGIGTAEYLFEIGPYLGGGIAADPVRAIEMAGIEQSEICAADFGELLDTYVTRLYFSLVGGPELIDRAHGHLPFDNIDVTYVGSADDSALNDAIGRFEADPDALKYYEHSYEPTGELRVPVLTLHNVCDPIATISHEEVYRATVEAAGSGEWLVQRQVNRYGHCAFTADEIISSFMDLDTWVETGVVPPGGDVTSTP
jgi:pimeloyl-ACP methyl ester carboxylesterase